MPSPDRSRGTKRCSKIKYASVPGASPSARRIYFNCTEWLVCWYPLYVGGIPELIPCSLPFVLYVSNAKFTLVNLLTIDFCVLFGELFLAGLSTGWHFVRSA